MCQSIIEGGRRCACDSSEARRLRRHNSQAINDFKPAVKPRFVAATKPAPATVGSIEAVYEKVDEIRALRDLIQNFSLYYNMPEKMPVPVVTLSDGTEITGRTPLDKVFEAVEKSTTELGQNINAVVEQRTGITPEQILETNKELIEKLTAEVDRIKEERTELEKLKEEHWPEQYNDEGQRKATSQRLWMDAYSDGDAYAVELYERGAKSLEDHVQAQHALSKAVNGKDEETRKLVGVQRAELVKVLSELRPIGGEIRMDDKSHRDALKALQEAQKVYPSSWIEASNNRDPFIAKKTTRRAHYSDGAYQKSFKVVDRKSFATKPEGWTPDPSKMHEVGSWHLANERGEWTDPETGIEYTGHSRPGERTWIYTPVEYWRSWGNEERLEAPPGRGWQKAMHMVKVHNPETGNYDKEVERTHWYRPIRKRSQVSAQMKPEITISGKGEEGYRVGLHEFAHRVEASGTVGDYIKTMEDTFLKRRTTDADGSREPLQKIYPRSREFGRPDNFASAYMGKVYDQGYREVLSTGAEAVFSDSYGGLIGLGNNTADKDMKNFIVGLWASA